MIVHRLRNLGDFSIGERGLQAVYVVLQDGVHLVWRKVTRVCAWFHNRGWSHDKGWFHS